jgi:hypothetical protein
MDKALQMACSEGDMGKSNEPSDTMLLATGGTSISKGTSTGRDKREETTTIKQKEKGRKAKAPTPKGKAGAKVKNLDGSPTIRPESKGHRRYDKDRQPDRGAEGKDSTLRRSAAELGISWIGSYCPDGQPHFLIGRHNFDEGVILNCRGCGKNLWLPTGMSEATKLDHLLDHYGANKGYQLYLDKHREAKCLVAKLQDLWYAKERMEDNEEFMKLIISVMEDKEYDRKDNQVA